MCGLSEGFSNQMVKLHLLETVQAVPVFQCLSDLMYGSSFFLLPRRIVRRPKSIITEKFYFVTEVLI